jgi:hypothetical protein
MVKIDDSWVVKAKRLPNGKWISVAVQQVTTGWHFAWWCRKSAEEDRIGYDVQGASAEPLPTEAAAVAAALNDAALR